jgi:hypothetical protein
MPLAFFLISVILSLSIVLSFSSIAQDSRLNQQVYASTAAFYTAESSQRLAWSEAKTDLAAKGVDDFLAAVGGEKQAKSDKSYLEKEIPEGLKLNVGIESASRRTQLKAKEKPFIVKFFQPGAELFFWHLREEQDFDTFRIDYCRHDEQLCPQLMVDVFLIKTRTPGFNSLQDFLQNSGTQPFDMVRDTMVMNGSTVERATTDTGLSYSTVGGGFAEWKQRFSLSGFQFLQGSSYLIRFRTLDRAPFHYQLSVIHAGQQKEFPNVVFEVDEISRARGAFRRLREQRQFLGGPQPGLEYVFFAHEFYDKNP